MWNRIPMDDAWKQVRLASVTALGQRIWLQCHRCSRNVIIDGLEFGREKGVDPNTPLLLIARRLRCRTCGEKTVHCWPEPYSIRRDEAV